MPYLLLSGGAFLILASLLGFPGLTGGGERRTGAAASGRVRSARPSWALLQSDLSAAGLPQAPRLLILASVLSGVGVAGFLWPLYNGTVLALSLVTGAALPYLWVRTQAGRKRRKIHLAMGQALVQLATVARTHPLPFQALRRPPAGADGHQHSPAAGP